MPHTMLVLAFVLFAPHGIETTSAVTRAGLAKWVATSQGQAIVEYLAANHCDITVIEDPNEGGVGRAPEPGLATMLAAYRHEPRRYVVILNPAKNGADTMSAAWAGEMLHIYFYAHGISLPHHSRDDFQQEWHSVAAELGMPTVSHDDDEAFPRHAVVRYVGYGR